MADFVETATRTRDEAQQSAEGLQAAVADNLKKQKKLATAPTEDFKEVHNFHARLLNQTAQELAEAQKAFLGKQVDYVAQPVKDAAATAQEQFEQLQQLQ